MYADIASLSIFTASVQDFISCLCLLLDLERLLVISA